MSSSSGILPTIASSAISSGGAGVATGSTSRTESPNIITSTANQNSNNSLHNHHITLVDITNASITPSTIDKAIPYAVSSSSSKKSNANKAELPSWIFDLEEYDDIEDEQGQQRTLFEELEIDPAHIYK